MGSASGLFENLLKFGGVEIVVLLTGEPLLNEVLLAAPNRLEVWVEEVGARLQGKSVGVEQHGFAVNDVGARIGKDF